MCCTGLLQMNPDIVFERYREALEADVRGTLLVDRKVPVGFQSIRCQVNIQAAEGADSNLVKRVVAASEHSCVNLQTLRSSISIETILCET